MAKLVLSDLGSLKNQGTVINTINDNNSKIETALENTLSRDGTIPNQMTADFDMNSNDILNVGEIDAESGIFDSLTLEKTITTFASLEKFNWQGPWDSGTQYDHNDIVFYENSSWISLQANLGHTPPTLPTESDDYWEVMVLGGTGPAGADGAPGADGADGADGVGIPVGGTTGQVLAKASNTDYDTTWETIRPLLGVGENSKYISPTGNDANDGSFGSPFATAAHALSYWDGFDANSQGLILNFADGTYSEAISIDHLPPGALSLSIVGNHTTPDNVIGLTVDTSDYVYILVDGIQTTHISAVRNSIIDLDFASMSFIGSGGVNTHINASDGGFVTMSGTVEKITGSAAWHLFASNGSIEYGPTSVNLVSTPAFLYYATAYNLGTIFAYNWNSTGVVTGTATGTKHSAEKNGIIVTGGYEFPGSIAGIQITGGWYDSVGTSSVLVDGDYGDIVISGTGTVISIDTGVIVNTDINASAAIDASKIANASVSNTEFQYLDGVTSAIQTQLGNKQPLATDLTTIAGLTPSNDDFLQRKAGAWANRTIAQVKTDLSLSGSNTGDQTTVSGNAGTATALQTARNIDGVSFNGTADITVIAPGTHAATSKATPVDADELPLVDSAASNVLKKLTWTNLKATLKTYLDTLYQPLLATLTSWGAITRASGFDTFVATPSSANLRALLTDEAGTGVAYFVNGALGTPASGTGTNLTGIPLTGLTGDTTTALGVGTIELGHATDTTLSRSSAGVLAVEGVVVSLNTTSQTHTASTLELGAATDTTLSRSAAGVLAVEGVVIPSISSTNTLTNKRVTPRIGSTTSSATPTINTDNVDIYQLTALAVAVTSMTTNLSGTPTEGQKFMVEFTGTATRAITWGTSFEASTVALPTTTVGTAKLSVGFMWNGVTSKWRCVAAA